MSDTSPQIHARPHFEAFVAGFESLVEETATRLAGWSLERVDTPLRPGGWTPRDMLVHLVDSASNNHGRFMRAGLGGPLRFEGYAQDDWVALQRQAAPDWDELLVLWRLLNRHVARLMRVVPVEVRTRAHAEHGLAQVAWENPPEDAPGTLEFFLRDYVAHLAHHLHALDPELCEAPRPQRDDSWYRSV